MPFDIAQLGDFMPMDHKTVQPISAKALRCYDETGTEIPGYHHIVRGDTNATIRVAPESYTVVQNEYLIDSIEQALLRSQLDLTDARFGVDYSHDGARMFAQWLLPAHTALVRPGVEATLRVIMLNAYDGSTAIHGRVGSYNWACANTAVSGRDFGSFRFTHAGQIDILPAIGKLTLAAEEHVETVKRWEEWPAIPVNDTKVRAVLSAIPKTSATQVDALVHAWLKARDEDPLQGGANLWCLYNVMTAWASDKNMGTATTSRAERNWDREKRVAQVVESSLWQELAAETPQRQLGLPPTLAVA